MMKFIYFREISSTQKVLLEDLKNNKVHENICYWSDYQTDGIGSRGNKWIGKRGNLFFSFVLNKNLFNTPIQSFSIYFGFILKKVLNDLGSKVVLKWPNDLYLIKNSPKKIGGVLTNIHKDLLVCGIGINTKFSPSNEFACLDIKLKNVKILNAFFKELEKRIDFVEIIMEYKKEFEKTKVIFNIEANLDFDGALIKNNKKVYSKR